MTAAHRRKVQRGIHLAAGFVLVSYVYIPLGGQLQNATRLLILPVLVVTGIAMWQAARIRRLLKGIGGQHPAGGK